MAPFFYATLVVLSREIGTGNILCLSVHAWSEQNLYIAYATLCREPKVVNSFPTNIGITRGHTIGDDTSDS